MFKPELLKGRNVLITGGGTGLGKSIGRRYMELGAELVICGRLNVPPRRFGEHIELANLCAYLVSTEAEYISGEAIVIDGGRWMPGVGGPSVAAMQGWSDEQWDAMRAKGRG